jgi:hypothetical protein
MYCDRCYRPLVLLSRKIGDPIQSNLRYLQEVKIRVSKLRWNRSYELVVLEGPKKNIF